MAHQGNPTQPYKLLTYQYGSHTPAKGAYIWQLKCTGGWRINPGTENRSNFKDGKSVDFMKNYIVCMKRTTKAYLFLIFDRFECQQSPDVDSKCPNDFNECSIIHLILNCRNLTTQLHMWLSWKQILVLSASECVGKGQQQQKQPPTLHSKVPALKHNINMIFSGEIFKENNPATQCRNVESELKIRKLKKNQNGRICPFLVWTCSSVE